MKIGEIIKDLRIEKKLTQKELAEIIKVDTTTITKYETNSRIPELSILIKLADYFNVSVDHLLGRLD